MKFFLILVIAANSFSIDKANQNNHHKQVPQDCPGGVCSARPVVDEFSQTDFFGNPALPAIDKSNSVPAAAKQSLPLAYGLSTAASIDLKRFGSYKAKILAEEEGLKTSLGEKDQENTVLVIGAETGCPRCDDAAKALRDKGYTVRKVPYEQARYVGSAMWLQSGQKGNPQFPFLAFWSGNGFVYRAYQP